MRSRALASLRLPEYSLRFLVKGRSRLSVGCCWAPTWGQWAHDTRWFWLGVRDSEVGNVCEYMSLKGVASVLRVCVSWLCPWGFLPRSPGSSFPQPATSSGKKVMRGQRTNREVLPNSGNCCSAAQPPHPPQPVIWARGPCQGSVASADLTNLGCGQTGTQTPRLCLYYTGPTPSWWAS